MNKNICEAGRSSEREEEERSIARRSIAWRSEAKERCISRRSKLRSITRGSE